MKAIFSGSLRLAGAALLLAAANAAQADETQTTTAFAVVETHGTMIPNAEGGMHVVGTVSGPFFLGTGHGPVDGGDLTCVADLVANANGTQTGSGSCVLTAQDGAMLYADWTCEGVFMVGCQGDFVVDGGTGRLEGVTGGGAMTMRTSETAWGAGELTSMAESNGRGILHWEAFSFVPPAAN